MTPEYRGIGFRCVSYIHTLTSTPGGAHACAVRSFQIDKGEIHATIDQANGMVVFHDNPEKFCTDAMAVEIDQQVCT